MRDADDPFRRVRREIADAERARRLPRVEPSAIVRDAVEALCAAILQHRAAFDALGRDGRLQRSWEAFRLELERAGFQVSGLERRDLAAHHRRLGEVADLRGDLRAAILHYEVALALWPAIGVTRRLAHARRVRGRLRISDERASDREQ